MDQETLSGLTVHELRSLCGNRDIDIRGRPTKQTLINKLLSYHKTNKYRKLKFDENLNHWKKDALVLELRATGTKEGGRNKYNIAYKLMNNGQSPIKNGKKTISKQNKTNNTNTNKTKKENKTKKKNKTKKENKNKIQKIEISKSKLKSKLKSKAKAEAKPRKKSVLKKNSKH